MNRRKEIAVSHDITCWPCCEGCDLCIPPAEKTTQAAQPTAITLHQEVVQSDLSHDVTCDYWISDHTKPGDADSSR